MKNVPPKVGTEWRVNFFRMDQPNGRPQSGTGWSPPMVGDFHALDKFGVLVFGDDKGHAPNAAAPGPAPATKARREAPKKAEAPRRRRPRSRRPRLRRRSTAKNVKAASKQRAQPEVRRVARRATSAMDELFDVLLHPSRWVLANAGELRPATRVYLSLLIFGVTLSAGVRRRLAERALGAPAHRRGDERAQRAHHRAAAARASSRW